MRSLGPLLCIESSGDSGGAAVLLGDRILSEVPTTGERTHGAYLVSCIDEATKQAGLNRQDLHGVLVNCGPGSYTGLRVGISAAETIALALGLPVLGVPCFDVMAAEWVRRASKHELQPEVQSCNTVLPVLDARQQAVSTAVYEVDLAAGNVARKCDDRLISPGDIAQLIGPAGSTVLFGPGVEPYLNDWPVSATHHIDPVPVQPASVGLAARRIWPDLVTRLTEAAGKRVEIRYFRPIMAQTIAQREAQKSQQVSHPVAGA